MNNKINLDYFLTINPLAEFTDEVKDYLQKYFVSYVYCVEHKNSNAHVHIIAHEHKRTMLRKSLNDDMKKKFPNLKGTKLVIKDVTDEKVYYYLCKEYNEPDFKLHYFNYEISPENQKKYYHLYKLNGKSKKEKFAQFFASNEEKYLRLKEYRLKECILYAFYNFIQKEDIKDIGPYAFEKYYYFLLFKLYPNQYFRSMMYSTIGRCDIPDEIDYRQKTYDEIFEELDSSNPDNYPDA